MIGSKLLVALITTSQRVVLPDLADQVLFACHRLRLFAGLGEPSGDIGLQGILADGGRATDSYVASQPATSAPAVARAPTAVVTVCMGRLLNRCWLDASQAFAGTIASWLGR